jgi:hypothetical protein
MTAQSKPYPRVELLISMFADWLTHRRELSEIRQMDRTDFDPYCKRSKDFTR